MQSRFFKLQEEKQKKIIDAGLEEFSAKGYEQARTERITEKAGIAKGLLFHYFGTKRAFFLFLLDYGLRLVQNEMLEKMKPSGDIFARIKEVNYLKIRLIQKHPALFNFLMEAGVRGLEKHNNEFEARISERIASIRRDTFRQLTEDLDTSFFREDVDIEKALEILLWFVEGFQEKALEEYGEMRVEEMDYDSLLEELDAYCDLLRWGFYRQDG